MYLLVDTPPGYIVDTGQWEPGTVRRRFNDHVRPDALL